MTKEPRIYNEGRTVYSLNGVEKTEQPNAKKLNWIAMIHHTQKLTQTGLNARLECKTWTHKTPNENIAGHFLDRGLGNGSDTKSTSNKVKINKRNSFTYWYTYICTYIWIYMYI